MTCDHLHPCRDRPTVRHLYLEGEVTHTPTLRVINLPGIGQDDGRLGADLMNSFLIKTSCPVRSMSQRFPEWFGCGETSLQLDGTVAWLDLAGLSSWFEVEVG